MLVYLGGAVIYGVASGFYAYYRGERLPIWVLILMLITVGFIADRVASPNKEAGLKTNTRNDEHEK